MVGYARTGVEMARSELTQEEIDLITEPNFGALATVQPDGSPQLTVLWVDHRDGLIWINTASGRAKPRNMGTDPRVSISIWDRNDHYRVVNVRGRVVESTTEGADDHARWLNRKYHGDDDFSFTPGTYRIIFKIEPESITRST